jgi:hypothetical protein
MLSFTEAAKYLSKSYHSDTTPSSSPQTASSEIAQRNFSKLQNPNGDRTVLRTDVADNSGGWEQVVVLSASGAVTVSPKNYSSEACIRLALWVTADIFD